MCNLHARTADPLSMYPYALLHMTGSDHFNRSMRKFAWLRDMSLSDHGLVHVVRHKEGGKTVKQEVGKVNFQPKTERDIFDLLHIPYVEPQDRHSAFAESQLVSKAQAESAGAYASRPV
jgi:DNA polymerase/3'-5' exonuclease PolX